MLACFYKGDFLTLTAVSIGIYLLDNVEVLRRQSFRVLVLMIFGSLIIDLVWLLFLNNYSND